MPSDPIHNGWTSVDDDVPHSESPVPVRIAETAIPQVHHEETTTQHVTIPHKRPEPAVQIDPRRMRLSAITGISIVLIGIVFYVGIDNLKGSLTDTGAVATTVTITADGHFDPTSVSLAAGTSLNIVNRNENPQVIKVKTGTELFGPQVIFDQPFNFSVPVNVTGSFTYFSETLPEDQIFTITVTPAIEAAAIANPDAIPAPNQIPDAAPANPVPAQDPNQIPMPFGSGPITPVPSSAAPVEPVPEVSVTPPPEQPAQEPVVAQEQNAVTEIFALGGNAQAPEEVSFDRNAIPTNPYVVGSEQRNNSAEIAAAQNLHSGAPLLIEQHRPSMNTSTGAETVWMALIPALLAMGFVYRKLAAV